MKTEWYQVEGEDRIASPALLLFKERIERNLAKMLEIAGGADRLRPHVKTHKLAPLVRRQVELGIRKFKAATIAEVEMCLQAGASDVLLAFPASGPNISRLCELVRLYPGATVSGLVDSAPSIRGLSVAARAAKVDVPVYLDLDCGMHRTGIAPGADALALYRLIAEQPGLIPSGLHAYDGHISDADPMERKSVCDAAFAPVEKFREELLAAGLPVPALIAGGSPTFAIHAAHAHRELSPGTSVLWDFGYGDKLKDLPFEQAAVLLTRAVSKPGMKRLCLDLGHKAVAAENPHPRVRLLELPEAEAVMQSEEHLVVETPDAAKFSIGQTLHGIPRHVCPTVALYNEALVVEGGRVTDRWTIDARGRRLTV